MDFENEFTYKKFLEQDREEEFDSLFDGAVAKVKSYVLGKRHPIYIDGKETYCASEIEEYSPIDRSMLIGRFQRGTRENAKQAIEAAHSAFAVWSQTDYKERIGIFRQAAAIFSRDKFTVAAILSIENGKTRYESIGEVDEAIDFLNYYSLDLEKNRGFVRKTKYGASSAKVSAGFQGAPGREENVRIALRPYGVFGVIAPFNFPISISTGMSSAALLTGNTVVFKPSSTDNPAMLTGLKIYEIFKEAGVPHGVFNYLTGPGSEVGDELVINPKVGGIAYTGSKSIGIGMIMKSYLLGQQKSFIVEMGGKNPAIVSKHADLAKAASGIASAAFGFAGQKCSACSRVYVHQSVKEEFISKLVDKMRQFKIGDPLRKEVYLGPLISDAALQKYNYAVAEANRNGKMIYGGKSVDTGLKGSYVEPTLAELDHASKLFHEELFIPFLCISTFKAMDEALTKANDTEYGLTAGFYSNKRGEINAFLGGIQAGVVYVNREISATTGAIVGLHTFVGWKGSGLTGKGTGSRFYLQQFMREQSQSVVK
ncbi:MAG: aldehyde dehydrogenase family protein [Candidatus Micrarchaeota archaeon]|nr:aldehyde dehydrogenase family protein [Candidatus Micrarchaeota archaeon]MDE1864167.1 aldehyde dehydrogenase family protein [Candidatus Micrarchaeota archaeon]